MNYSAMIQNRRSVHAFREKEVSSEAIDQLRSYYEKTCPRLVPEIATELIVLDKDAQPALESSAGYNQFLIGAPHYLLLMSAPHSYAAINAGYMMEDLVLKLTELDIDTCWMTFTDSDKIKKGTVSRHPVRGGGNRCLWLRGKDRKKASAEYPKYVSDRCAGRAAVLRAPKGCARFGSHGELEQQVWA